MNNIIIKESAKTPLIETQYKIGKIDISGRSIPENSIDFYKPLLDSLSQYAQNPYEKTELHIFLDYFNTSSSKCLLDVFKIIESIHQNGHKALIIWKYDEEDEDMQEAGEDYESIMNVPFQFETITI